MIFLLSTVMMVHAEDLDSGKFRGASPLEWSQRLARSEMGRRGDTLFKDGSAKARWDYTSGLFASSLLALGERTDDKETSEFGTRLVGSFAGKDGSIATYDPSSSNIDMVAPGKALLELYGKSGNERIKTAILTLKRQLDGQPRTSDGGFWHKKRYPLQMWLDGLYMGSPFLAGYGRVFNDPAAFDEVVKQILLADKHTYDPATGLFHHGWDEKHAQTWADPATGCSPSFWGRAMGWYAMAVVDCLDELPPDHPGIAKIREIQRKLADGIIRYQDPGSGLWWQVLDQGGREGNYLEASASGMFVYALAKGIRRGDLPREKYLPAVLKGYEGLVRDRVRVNDDGSVDLTKICEVAGLGFTSASGKPRDGSYAYYISEPVVDNDLKGVAPFILAGLEIQKLLEGDASTGWSQVPGIIKRIHAPEFPDKDFPITKYGAVVTSDCTRAINDAIRACHDSGGGRVVIPAGEWRTGAIELLGNVNLHLLAGSTLAFSTDPAAYPLVFTRWEGTECMNHSSLIHAIDQENVAVTGSGTLDGQADWSNWWGWNNKRSKPIPQKAGRDRLVAMGEAGVPVEERKFGDGGFLRPNFIQFYRCRNVMVEGVEHRPLADVGDPSGAFGERDHPWRQDFQSRT